MAVQVRNKDGLVLLELENTISCDLSDRTLLDVTFDDFVLEGAYFACSKLINASFCRADLYWCNFFEANLTSADFTEADIRGSDFTEANLSNAIFHRANMAHDNVGGVAIFCGANLAGTDFRGADLTGVNFKHAKYSPHTLFPVAFNPKIHGLELFP